MSIREIKDTEIQPEQTLTLDQLRDAIVEEGHKQGIEISRKKIPNLLTRPASRGGAAVPHFGVTISKTDMTRWCSKPYKSKFLINRKKGEELAKGYVQDIINKGKQSNPGQSEGSNTPQIASEAAPVISPEIPDDPDEILEKDQPKMDARVTFATKVAKLTHEGMDEDHALVEVIHERLLNEAKLRRGQRLRSRPPGNGRGGI